MGSCRIYRTGSLSAFSAYLHIQEASVALLPLRSLLLRDDLELCLFLVPAIKSGFICSLLLSVAWFTR